MTQGNDFPVNPDAHKSCRKLFIYYSSFFHLNFDNKKYKAFKAKYNAELTKAEKRMVSKEETE